MKSDASFYREDGCFLLVNSCHSVYKLCQRKGAPCLSYRSVDKLCKWGVMFLVCQFLPHCLQIMQMKGRSLFIIPQCLQIMQMTLTKAKDVRKVSMFYLKSLTRNIFNNSSWCHLAEKLKWNRFPLIVLGKLCVDIGKLMKVKEHDYPLKETIYENLNAILI